MNEIMMKRAERLLREWKGDNYMFGLNALEATGAYAARYGRRALVFAGSPGKGVTWASPILEKVKSSLSSIGVTIIDVEPGARPNAPREDVYRMALAVARVNPDCIVAVGGGSTIDAAKAAAILNSCPGNDIEPYFGVDQVTAIAKREDCSIIPVVAVMTASSSSAHLTKYSNITDTATGTKKLIVDDIIVPPAAVFDYSVTHGSPMELILDGGLDGISHCWEVFMGATGKVYYEEMKEIAVTAMGLIIEAIPSIMKSPAAVEGYVAHGLGTDLGGYAIMIGKRNPETNIMEKGGTNGGHLGSFQLVRFLAHGRACAILNPYYTVLFANAIEDQNRSIGPIYQQAGFIDESVDFSSLSGRELAEKVANGMIAFSKSIGFPATLKEAGVPESQMAVMIEASRNPQLKMKLQNMPTPLDVEKGEIDTRMAPTLKAAFTGDLSLIP